MEAKRETERRALILKAEAAVKAFEVEVEKAQKAGIADDEDVRELARQKASIERIKAAYLPQG